MPSHPPNSLQEIPDFTYIFQSHLKYTFYKRQIELFEEESSLMPLQNIIKATEIYFRTISLTLILTLSQTPKVRKKRER